MNAKQRQAIDDLLYELGDAALAGFLKFMEVKAIGDYCKKHGLYLHLDGARISNAAAALGAVWTALSMAARTAQEAERRAKEDRERQEKVASAKRASAGNVNGTGAAARPISSATTQSSNMVAAREAITIVVGARPAEYGKITVLINGDEEISSPASRSTFTKLDRKSVV